MNQSNSKARSLQHQDRFIAFAVMLSPVLIMIQQILIDVFNMGDSSTTYRVIMTAIPLSIAIFLGFIRFPLRFAIAYIGVITVLLIHAIVFPQNYSFMLKDAFRFTLPIVVSSSLCLSCISDIQTINRTVYVVSWLVLGLTLFYVMAFALGRVRFNMYSMSVSYALLLPMMSFYSHRRWYDSFALAFLLLVVIVLGSRGALVAFGAYAIYDIISMRRKQGFLLVFFIVLLVIFLPKIVSWLANYGISSRTLDMIVNGSIMGDSGRNEVRNVVWDALKKSPVFGLGLWGDRVLLRPLFSDAIYCHNLFLEILVDFGFFIGGFIILGLIISSYRVFLKSKDMNRRLWVMFTCALIIPMMLSGSYLIDQFLGIYLGILSVFSHSH